MLKLRCIPFRAKVHFIARYFNARTPLVCSILKKGGLTLMCDLNIKSDKSGYLKYYALNFIRSVVRVVRDMQEIFTEVSVYH